MPQPRVRARGPEAAGSRLPVAIFDDHWATTLTFTASLGRRGVPLHFYGSGAGRFSRYCSKRSPCPPVNDMDKFLPWLRDEVRLGRIGRIAPTNDLIAYYTALIREEFSPEVQRSILPLNEIENCLIKTRFAEKCGATGQPTPATATPDGPGAAAEMARGLGYPLMLKPKSHLVVGWNERGRLIRSAEELERHFIPYPVLPGHETLARRLPELRWPLLQRYLPSARQRVYSVTGIKDPTYGIVVTSLSYKSEQWPQDVGTSTVQVSSRNASILQAGVEAIDRLISRGLFELELVSSGDKLLAIDLNPRAFGFIALDVALGRDLPWLWLQSTLGPLEPQKVSDDLVGRLEARHHFIHFIRSLIDWSKRSDSAHGNVDDEPARASISMVGHKEDPLPMLISNLALLRHPRSLIMTQLQAARHARRRRRGF